MQIMQKPKNAITKQYKQMFKIDGVDLEFEDSAITAVAKKAIELKTGARGLRTILEDSMMDLMFLAPSDKTIKKIVLDDKSILKSSDAKIIRITEEEAKKSREKKEEKPAS